MVKKINLTASFFKFLGQEVQDQKYAIVELGETAHYNFLNNRLILEKKKKCLSLKS